MSIIQVSRRALVIAFVISTMTICNSRVLAHDNIRMVHIDCESDRGAVFARYYMAWNNDPIPKDDLDFTELARDHDGLSCKLSRRYTIIFHAMASGANESHDNLEILIKKYGRIDTSDQLALSIDQPIADSIPNYVESVRITTNPSGTLHVTNTSDHDTN